MRLLSHHSLIIVAIVVVDVEVSILKNLDIHYLKITRDQTTDRPMDRPMDGPTDGLMDITSYKDA